MDLGLPACSESLLACAENPMIIGLPRLREAFGRVQLSIEGDQPWVTLRRDWPVAGGSLMEFTGRLNLGHSLRRTRLVQAWLVPDHRARPDRRWWW